MPFEIVRNDITKMVVDAIVNTANPKPVVGAGTDATIHRQAGPELLAARQQIGNIAVGSAAVTPGYGLPARYVIHTVGPLWRGGLFGEKKQLRACYDEALRLAREMGCRSVAFPLISSGNYGFPKDQALQVAIVAFSSFLTEHEMQIYLVVFDRDSYKLSEKLFKNVASYIDQHYVDLHPAGLRRRLWEEREMKACAAEAVEEPAAAPMAAPAPKAMSLAQMLKQADAGFTQKLLELIDQSGKKDSTIYKKANLTKQHFSKIRNNPDYKPTKPTAIALALALELDVEGMRDLIGRAGYALTNSSKFDLIIRYFVEQGVYDVVQINLALYEFDQPILGS